MKWRTLTLLTSLLVSDAHAWLESGEIRLRFNHQDNRPVISDPQGTLLDTPSSFGRLYGLLKLQESFDDLRLVAQWRPRFDYEEGNPDAILGIDELYLDYPLTPALFVSAGRRNLFTGIALGRNPVDYFGANKSVDTSLSAEERRDQRQGDYMVNLEWYLDNANLSAYFAPRIDDWQEKPNQLLVRYNRLFDSINTDIGLLWHDGERDGIGLTLSKTLSDTFVAYAEASWDKGRDRSLDGVTQNTSSDHYLEAVIGTNFTFDNGLNHILEYWHHGTGYTDSEWDSLLDQIDLATRQLNTPDAGLANQQLAAINQGLEPRLLRKNYLFNRLSYSFDLGRLSLSVVHIASMDDHSHLLRVLLEKTIQNKYQVALQLQQTFGASDTEFGIRSADTLATLDFKVLF